MSAKLGWRRSILEVVSLLSHRFVASSVAMKGGFLILPLECLKKNLCKKSAILALFLK